MGRSNNRNDKAIFVCIFVERPSKLWDSSSRKVNPCQDGTILVANRLLLKATSKIKRKREGNGVGTRRTTTSFTLSVPVSHCGPLTGDVSKSLPSTGRESFKRRKFMSTTKTKQKIIIMNVGTPATRCCSVVPASHLSSSTFPSPQSIGFIYSTGIVIRRAPVVLRVS
jgi:hypothetical protein